MPQGFEVVIVKLTTLTDSQLNWLVHEVFGLGAEPLLFAMNGLIISLAFALTKLSSAPTSVTYNLKQTFTITCTNWYVHFFPYPTPTGSAV